MSRPAATVKSLSHLENAAEFHARHIGPDSADERHMLDLIGEASSESLVAGIVPASIARRRPIVIPAAIP